MQHLRIELGPGGEPLVIQAAKAEYAYRRACVEAFQAGRAPDKNTRLPSRVTKYVCRWAAQKFLRDSSPEPPEPEILIYHLPAQTWSLVLNGLTFMVRRENGTRARGSSAELTRVGAVFLDPPQDRIDQNSTVIISKQARGWLATFRPPTDRWEE